jgi:hypothetical protein
MFEEQRRSTTEICRLIDENRLLVSEGLGLFQPGDLYQSLTAIASSLVDSDEVYSTPEAVAYFLGHEIASLVWETSYRETPVAPFVGLEKVTPNNRVVKRVIRIGCPSVGSLRAGQKFLSKANLAGVSQTIIDLSPLPLHRLKVSCPGTAEYLLADASIHPIASLKPDLVITDMLFSEANAASQTLLNNLVSSLPEGGSLLTRICLIPESVAPNYFRLMEVIGHHWGDFCRRTFGVDNQLRDHYFGLTKEQWFSLGQVYARFVRETYYGPDRFRTVEDACQFLTGVTGSTLDATHTLIQPIGQGELSFLSVAVRKT